MHKLDRMHRIKILSKTLMAAGIFTASLNLYAENLPLTLAFTETLSRDSNLYRVEPGQYAVADTVSSTGLKIGLDKYYGRQHYTATLGSAINRYFDSQNLNNTSYDLNFNTASEVSDKGLLTVNGGASQNLARFDVAGYNTIDTIKNTQKTSNLGGQLSYGGYGTLNPYISFNHYQQGFTVTNSNYQAANQNTYGVGTYYSIVPQLNIGLGLRRTNGDVDYDDGSGGKISNNFRRRDIDLSMNWSATGLSSLYARISATHEKDNYEPNSNLLTPLLETESKSWTSEINWQYTPQGRLAYALSYSRDKGNVGRLYDNTTMSGADYFGLSEIQKNENNRLTDTINAKITWDATYKIKINAAAALTKYRLDQSTQFLISNGQTGQGAATPNQTSTYTQYSIGGQYQFARWLNLYCDVKRIKRTEDAEYRPFNATVTACTGQFNINGMN